MDLLNSVRGASWTPSGAAPSLFEAQGPSWGRGRAAGVVRGASQINSALAEQSYCYV